MRDNGKEVLYATGLVKPKTTALFFDKLWIPNGLEETKEGYELGVSDIPKEVRFVENEKTIKLPRRRLSLQNKELIEAFRHFDYPHACIMNNAFMSPLEDEKMAKILGASRDLELNYLKEVKIEKPVYSVFRNWGLNFYSQFFKAIYNINLVPIFFDRTEFEKALASLDESKLIKLRNDLLENSDLLGRGKQKTKLLMDINSQGTNSINVYEVSIKNVPMIVEESLSWEQVLEMRDDEDSIEKLRNFRVWANATLVGKSNNEIEDILNKTIEEYKKAIKKFGLKTCISGFTTILSSISAFLKALGGNKFGTAGAIIGVGTSAIKFVEGISNIRQVHKRPIAYYYDILNL